MGFNPKESSVTHYEPGEPIRRPSFKKRQPTGNGAAQPLPSKIGVTKGTNPHKTVSREDQFAEGSVGDLAQYCDESVSGMDAHMIQMAIESGDDDIYNEVINII